MVDPAARVLVPQGDRVEGRVVNSVLIRVFIPVVMQWVALPVIAGPVMAVRVGLTTPGVRVQVMLGQAGQAGQVVRSDKADKADKVVSPENMAGIPSGKWSVPNPFRGKTAAASIRMAVVDPVVVGAIVDVAQTLAGGLAVRAIGNASPVSFKRKVFRVR